MGAKSCEKSLETFALDHNPAIWSKSLQTFLATEVATKVARRKLYRFGCPCYCQILVDCSLGSHNPIHKHTRVRAPHRRTPHETWRASTTSQKRLLSQQQLQQPARVHEIGLGTVAREGRRAACFGRWLDEDCREARQFVVAFRVPYEMFRGIVEAVAPAFPSATHDVAGRECFLWN